MAFRRKMTARQITKSKAAFLLSLSETAQVRVAVKAAKCGRSALYDWRDLDPKFKRDWEAALERGMDVLEDEAARRGKEGVLEPVYQGGKKVGTVRKYSDTLLMFLLNGGRPEKYKHRIDHTTANQPLRTLTEPQLDARITKLLTGGDPVPAAANDAQATDVGTAQSAAGGN